MRSSARQFPISRLLRLSVALIAALGGPLKVGGALAASVVVTVQSSDGHPLSGAVVTVHALSGNAHRTAAVQAVMDQINRAFSPDLLVIPVGSTVSFPNSDSVSHQIYSFSLARKFQLPLYRGNPNPPVSFDTVGIVTLGCNIHDFMLAYIVVTDASYFGKTDRTGSWSAELPRGAYSVTVWHPRMREDGEIKRELSTGENDRTALTLRLSKPLQPAPLAGKARSEDAY